MPAASYKQQADQRHRFKVFTEGDLVMVHLRKQRLPAGSHHKLQAKKIGPCRILRKINENAYVVDLPKDLQIS